MRFKILFIVLSLIIFSAESFPQGTWEKIDSPTDQFLKSTHFVDSLYGWAVGDSGTIIHTSDGGDNWIVQDSKILNEIVQTKKMILMR
ncbi:YCF48-related protein [Bacteroidota bacterium]